MVELRSEISNDSLGRQSIEPGLHGSAGQSKSSGVISNSSFWSDEELA
jgi:hypothetical protein